MEVKWLLLSFFLTADGKKERDSSKNDIHNRLCPFTVLILSYPIKPEGTKNLVVTEERRKLRSRLSLSLVPENADSHWDEWDSISII